MFQLGLTGGIGSGKTLVCSVFEKLGVPVYYADVEAKNLMNSDPVLKGQIVEIFGEGVYSGGILKREVLAERVFGHSEMLNKLNAVVHPAVSLDYLKWVKLQGDSAYVVEEAAILFESGANKHMDFTVLVFAPVDLRIQRVMMRDQSDKVQVEKRMKHQMSDEEKKKLADHIIYNDGKQMLLPQIIELHNKILNKE